MKKLLSLVLALALALTAAAAFAADIPDYVNTESLTPAVKEGGPEVTVSILTTRNSTATNDVEDTWFAKYLADAMNVKLELEQTLETQQRISLMFASDSVPDLVWGIQLSNNDIMAYGVGEGMLLDWSDLLTEELMPNACKAMEDYPDAFLASTTPDGAIYTLPMISGSRYYTGTGSFSQGIRMYINQDWLDACGLEMPTTLDEYLNVLRTFKEKDPMGLGENNIPLIGNQHKDKELIWNALGFYGAYAYAYGTNFTLKGKEVVLPCYTEEAKTFLKFYNTLYAEGLISPDYFTLDQTTTRGLIASGICGVMGDSTLTAVGDNWKPWVGMSPLTSEYNDTAIACMAPAYKTGVLYASAEAEHPEVLARIVDFMYSDEGALLYFYGPMKDGNEPLYGIDGWYFDENGLVTNDKVVSGEFTDISDYGYQLVKFYSDAPGRFDHYRSAACKAASREDDTVTITLVDQLTGATLDSLVTDVITDDSNNGHWRTTQAAALADHLTQIMLPGVYLSAEDTQRAADLSTVINDYVNAESAKFIVGARPLEELDTYFEELKALGIEEYIEIYRNAWAGYVESIQ